MKTETRYLIAALALVSLFFVFPPDHRQPHDPIDTTVLLLLASAGILLSRMFILSSDSSDKTGIEPAVIVTLATWGITGAVYPLVALMTFTGSILNSIRMQKNLSLQIPEAVFQGVSFAFLLKLSGFFYWNLSGIHTDAGAIRTYLSIIAAVIPVTALRCIAANCFNNRISVFSTTFKKGILLNTFIVLLAVPSAMGVLKGTDRTQLLISCTFGLFAILVVHGINLRQNRSAHEKTDELETVIKLKELSGNLFSATSEMEALRTISSAVSTAWSCRVAVQWKSLKYFHGSRWDTADTVCIKHNAGLTIWIDSFSSTIPMYMESFLNRAVPVLTDLEARKKMETTSWEAMEAMVSFVEQNSSDFAGFSRRVAATATRICRSLKKDVWFQDCMRLAGLLHMVSLPKRNKDGSPNTPHALPEITLQALEEMTEHWGGTGPSGKSGEQIPLPARILAVSIAWERAMNSGETIAVRDMNMRAGTLYDPRLSELVIQLNG
ncbi:hypothetical protein DRQ21_08130 [Candidatus Fermentibacteria bacterium]|nr:MAG: hypothetical protein DRQ21_08130 [Candidatus Fermentibacteria bacterium]